MEGSTYLPGTCVFRQLTTDGTVFPDRCSQEGVSSSPVGSWLPGSVFTTGLHSNSRRAETDRHKSCSFVCQSMPESLEPAGCDSTAPTPSPSFSRANLSMVLSPTSSSPILLPFKGIMSLIRNCLPNRISHGNLLSPPIHSISSGLMSCNFLLISEALDHLRDINFYLFFDPLTRLICQDTPHSHCHHPPPTHPRALTAFFLQSWLFLIFCCCYSLLPASAPLSF